ncbi:MAG: 3'-5' exonuclease [Wenzhouxiangella sp.]|jgi:DNA polymerase-3 subunit epsilon|nr:3'-5' exonuclease [Wenzhouxiangella sp.]
MAQLAEATTIPMLKAYFGAGVVNGSAPLADVPFVALDLETTGLDPQDSAIVSIGLVPFSLRRIRVSDSKYWVVRPRRELAPESVLIHRITHEELEGAPRFSAVLPELLEALAGCVVVVHYRGIERPFLDQVCRRWMGEGLEFPLIDTMTVEAWSLRDSRSWLQKVGGWLGVRGRASTRLAACRQRYHLPVYTAHHAMTDALATAELFQAQVAWHLDEQLPVERLWL